MQSFSFFVRSKERKLIGAVPFLFDLLLILAVKSSGLKPYADNFFGVVRR